MSRMAELLSERSSSITLAWLASHRGRLRTLALGGHRLSVLLVWDRKGSTEVKRTPDDLAAIYQLAYGQRAPVAAFDEPLDDHVTTVKEDAVPTYDGGYYVWQASCSCGWLGSFRGNKGQAHHDAASHEPAMSPERKP